uniref:Aldehyde dehydrogenase domain-containing protein n=1 Tax=Rhizochromulina marina TaxID=1034831 RepID=A0A7S2SHB5_9STRA
MPATDRGKALHRMAHQIREERLDLARWETLDCGKPLAESLADMDACADFFSYYAEIAPKALESESLPVPEDGVSSHLTKEPVGVVGCITPWNFPLMQAVVKVAPALAAGCSVVLKPSPWASLTCLHLGRIAASSGVPPGVLNVITGGPPGGDAGVILGQHPDLDKLSFTGSGPTGQALLHASAENLRPTSLELGGKSAMIVLEDADLESCVDWAMVGIFLCTGQVCSATSRLLVHEAVADRFLGALVDATRHRLRVGDPLDPETNMGPCVSREQLEKINRAIESARVEGCEALLGDPEEWLSPAVAASGGFYVAPQIFKAPLESSLWNEEVFGPVLAVHTFSTDDEAVALANATCYGLANCVMGSSTDRVRRVSASLRSGVVWENCNQPLYPSTPFGGCKQSGFGREYGHLGLEEFVSHKTTISADPGFCWNWYQPSTTPDK